MMPRVPSGDSDLTRVDLVENEKVRLGAVERLPLTIGQRVLRRKQQRSRKGLPAVQRLRGCEVIEGVGVVQPGIGDRLTTGSGVRGIGQRDLRIAAARLQVGLDGLAPPEV